MSQLHHPARPLQRWQALTRDANARFAQGRLDEAIDLYRQALELAEALLSAGLSPDAAIAAYTASCLNLAGAYDRANDAGRAAEVLAGIHLHLLGLALDPAPSQGWRDAALDHSHRSHLELQHFLRTHEHAGIARLLQAFHPPASHLN